MLDSPKENIPKLRKRRRHNFLPLLLLIIAISALAVFLFQAFYPGKITDEISGEPVSTTVHQPPHHSGSVDQANSSNISPTPLLQGSTNEIAAAQKSEELPASDAVADAAVTATDLTQPVSTSIVESSRSRIATFYNRLDNYSFFSQISGGVKSREYLGGLIQNLLANPPIVSGERDDLYGVLRNSAHFFRIAGKENIQMLKSLMAAEKVNQEQLLADYFLLSIQSPMLLADDAAIELASEALYDYAGYFLTTMGGRLYLFRRDAALRNLVSYYSILIVDQANNQGSNRHGIDLLPPVANLISEIENSGDLLRYRSHYLETLYRLQEKYLNREY